MVGAAQSIPQWLESLLAEKFFTPCSLHESAKKNEKNVLCLDCCTCICSHCLFPAHRPHRLLQIRRYVYNDVIRLEDMERLIDCSLVQPYTTNAAKVVFLKERPHSRPFRSSGNICLSCDRSLQDGYQFCSIACKVKHLVKADGNLSKHLHDCQFLPFQEGGKGESELDDGQTTTDSVLESTTSLHSGSNSSGNGEEAGYKTALTCTATTEFVRKKRSSISAAPRSAFRSPCRAVTATATTTVGEMSSAHLNKRKGVPNRSPMY